MAAAAAVVVVVVVVAVDHLVEGCILIVCPFVAIKRGRKRVWY